MLSFDYLRRGARAYVAMSGGIDVPVVLGSRSTYVLGALGGQEGRALNAGDRLPLGTPQRKTPLGVTVPEVLRRGENVPGALRLIPGLYHHRVQPESMAGFLAGTWVVAPEADRIGYRFRGGTPLAVVDREPPLRRGLGSIEHRRQLLSLRLDPGAGAGSRSYSIATRCRAEAVSCSGP